MIVVDTSAVIAIWKKEPEAAVLEARLSEERAYERRISSATYIETGTVLAGGVPKDPFGVIAELNAWLTKYAIEVVPLDAEQAGNALGARIRFGRGFGAPAKLNLGDCFSYALAKTLKAPLLYIGDDFDKTDVRSALRKKRKKAK